MTSRYGAGVAITVLLLGAVSAAAFPSKLASSGRRQFTYGEDVEESGGAATTSKPESKLFYTSDGRWWAVLGNSEPAGVFLYQLDGNHVWQRLVQLPGADPWAKADALLDGNNLYVALRDNRSSSSSPRRSELYRLTYQGSGTWSAPAGPTLITTSNPETLTIARDSLDRLWTTFESSEDIKVGVTSAGGTSFSISNLPVSDVNGDDISAVTAFGTSSSGFKIGVFWSDQESQRDRFAWRRDTDPVGSSSWHIETAYGGGVGGCTSLCADDHINVKVRGDEVYVAVKTSKNNVSSPDPNAPLIALLRRSAGGTWSSFRVSPVSQDATRPVLLLAPALDRIFVFAPRSSTTYAWESNFGSPGFDPSKSTVWTKPSSGKAVDPTSTKQVITSTSGAIVETSNSSREEYWHNEFLP